MKQFKDQKIVFKSKIRDYTDKYEFSIQIDKVNLFQEHSVTEFYDEKGYLHRYKVREMLDSAINNKLEEFNKKK